MQPRQSNGCRKWHIDALRLGPIKIMPVEKTTHRCGRGKKGDGNNSHNAIGNYSVNNIVDQNILINRPNRLLILNLGPSKLGARFS